MAQPRDLGTRGDGRYRVVDESRIVANIVRNLFPYEAAAHRAEADAAARSLLERWITAGLPWVVERGRRLFDPCEAMNFALAAWLDDGDPTWFDRQVLSSRRMVCEMRALPEDTWFRATLAREFNLNGIAAGSSMRLRLPLPVDARVDAITLDAAATAAGATGSISPGRFELRFALPAPSPASVTVTATLAAQATATGLRWEDVEAGTPGLGTAAAAENARYLRHEEGLIRVSAAVAEHAAALAPVDASPKAVVAAIWAYFMTQMRVSFIHYDELDAADPMRTVLERRWCDCHVGSSLFVALCRARGIPARLTTGGMLYSVTPSQHSWLEVLLPPHGWLPIDLTGCFLAARSLTDPEWSQYFLGHLDPRMVLQRLPDVFTGAVGVRATPSWYLLQTLEPGGTEMAIGCLDERRWLWRDTMRVTALAGPG
jgi:transglutaminase-like putative cysteine protease